jgi:tagatose 6-phosphate kinase
MLYTVTLNPSLDRTLTVDGFHVGGTFKASGSDLLPAGKGINVARVAATLGARVVAVALVGEDDLPAFAGELARTGIESRLIAVPGATRGCVTILDPVGHTVTHVRERGRGMPIRALEQVKAALAGLAHGDWIVLAGSLPPDMPEGTYRELIGICSAHGAHTLLDTNGSALLAGVAARPTALRLNLFELWQLDGQLLGESAEVDLGEVPLADVLSSVRRVQERGIEMVVVSMGARGAVGGDADGRIWWAGTRLDQPVVDAVGSGDAFGGGWVVAEVRRESFPDALRMGVACGAANALVAGAGRCRRSDIDRLADRAVVREV